MELKETVIRRMTRLAIEYGAVNLSQGFTDEAPVYDMVWGGVAAMIGGTEEGVARIRVDDVARSAGRAWPRECGPQLARSHLEGGARGGAEPARPAQPVLVPVGLPELRHAIADYTEDLYGCRPDPEEQITVVLGASEGMAVAFRSLLEPGDRVIVMQPFHELYPSQAAIFGWCRGS